MPVDFSTQAEKLDFSGQAQAPDFSSQGVALNFAAQAQPVAKKTRAQVLEAVTKAQAQRPVEQMSSLEQVGNAAYWPARVASRLSPLTAVGDALEAVVGHNPLHTPTIAPEMVRGLLSNIAMADVNPLQTMPQEGTVGKEIENFLTSMFGGLSTPEGVIGMMSGKVPQLGHVGPATSFIPGMVTDAPLAWQDLRQSQGAQETTENALRFASDVLFPLGMARGATAEMLPTGGKASGLRQGDISATRYMDGRTSPYLLPERGMNPPDIGVNVIKPVEGEGRTIYRLPDSGQPRALLPEVSDYTKSLEAEALSAAQVAQNPPIRSDIKSERPVDPKTYLLGREQGVRAELSPDQIKGMVQELIDSIVPQQETSPVPQAPKGMQIKAAMERGQKRRGETGSVFPTGGEGRAKSDWQLYQDVQAKIRQLYQDVQAKIREKMKVGDFESAEFRQLWQENENIKNRHGGMPPKEEQSGGLGGGMTRAIEKNKEGGSIANPFPALVEKFKNREKELRGETFALSGPRLALDPKESGGVYGGVQRLKDYASEFKEATTPQGFGKLGKTIGGLIDPRAKAEGNETMQALNTWHRQVEKGRNMAAVWAESRRRAEDLKADDKGQITLADGSKDYISDVFEKEEANPGSQKLTKEQAGMLRTWQRIKQETSAWLKEEGVKGFLENGEERIDLAKPYMTRPAIGTKAGGVQQPNMASKPAVGAERYFQKRRSFPTERMGAEAGIIYDPSFYGRVTDYLQNAYRAVADQRLSKHMKKLSDPEHKFMVNTLTYHPAFRGQHFGMEQAKVIGEAFQQPNKYVQGLSSAVQEFKKYKFTSDVSMWLNQGLPIMFANPKGWAKAVGTSLKSLPSEKALSRYLGDKDNLHAAQRIVANGGSIGNVWEFIGGGREKGFAEKIPPIRASGRAMGVFLDVAKIEMYKSMKPLMEKNGWSEPEMVEAIGNMVFSSPGKTAGVSSNRAIAERLIFNAPNYMRAAANLLAMTATDTGKNSPSGYVARRAVIGLGVAIMTQMGAMYYAAVQSGVMSQKEMEDRLNPASRKFLWFPVDVSLGEGMPQGGTDKQFLADKADDRRIELSYGNIMIGIARAAGAATAILSGKEEGAVLGDKNPLIRFFNNRLSPWIGAIKKVATGKNYKGDDITWYQGVAEELTPIVFNPLFDKQSMNKAGAGEMAWQMVGGAAKMEGFGARKGRLENEMASRIYRAPGYENLGVSERRKVSGLVGMQMMSEEKDRDFRAPGRAIELAMKRAVKVEEGLSEASRELLRGSNLKIPNVEVGKLEGGKMLRLSEEEQQKLMDSYMMDLDRRLSNRTRSYPGKVLKKEAFEGINQAAREHAWSVVSREINARRRQGKEVAR